MRAAATFRTTARERSDRPLPLFKAPAELTARSVTSSPIDTDRIDGIESSPTTEGGQTCLLVPMEPPDPPPACEGSPADDHSP